MNEFSGLSQNLLSRKYFPYYFLVPFFLIFGVFYVWPILWAPWMSLHEFGLQESQLIGLENYRLLYQRGTFLTALYNTFLMAAIIIPLQVVGGLLIAVLLDTGYVVFKKYVQSLFLLPTVMALTVLAMIFDIFLASNGLLNLFLDSVVSFRVQWLNDPFWAKISVATVFSWRMLGISILVYLAGLQGIPPHLYKAAKIDGANKFQQFRYVTVPQLRPMIVFVAILSTTYSIRMFDVPYVLTDGGPGNASQSIVHLIYNTAFLRFELGLAAAMGSVLTVILATILVVEYRIWGETE